MLDRRVLGGRCPISMLPGGSFRACWGSSQVGPANPAGPDGPVVAGGPIGPCVAFSPLSHEVLEPLEHSIMDDAGPAGRHVAVGPVGPLRTLSPSDCHPAGPAGPYVAGGPVGPDGTLNKVLEPILEHSVLDHVDPAGQHAVFQEVLEPLEHSVLDAALDGRPMEGIPVLDPLEHSVLEMALDGGPLEEMSNLEPLEHSVLNVALDCQLMEGIPFLEPLEHSVLEMALDGRLMEGMSFLELLEHSVLDVALDSRLMEGMSVLEPLEHLVPDVARDWGDNSLLTITVPDPLEHSGLGETDDVKPGVVPPELLEHSVLVAPRNEGGVSVASVDKLDPIEHVEPSGTVPTVPSGSAILVEPGGRTALPGDGGPKLGPDVQEDDLVLGAADPLPAENIDQVTLSPVRVSTCDVTTDGNITAGLDSWNLRGMCWISTRHLTGCQCIMAVICMIQRIQIGMIRMQSQVRHMWKNIILTFRRGWT